MKIVAYDNKEWGPMIRLFTKHLEEIWRPRLSANLYSGYARGRMQCWMNWQPTLVKDWTQTLAPRDDTLWDFLRMFYEDEYKIYPDLGLVTLAGNIAPHRDSTYAHREAMTLSIGQCTWIYDGERHELSGANIIYFDCKIPHSVEDAAPDRWSINVWRFK